MALPQYEVVVPAKDAASTLETTIVSLREQTHPPTRITVVDDGSLDGTGTIARQNGARCLPTVGVGLALAQNYGLSYVESDYVAFVDADDVWTPQAAAILITALAAREQVAAVSGGAGLFGPELDAKEVLELGRGIRGDPKAPLRRISPREVWERNPFTKSATLFRSDALREAGGYRQLVSAEDYDLLLRMLATGWELTRIETVTCLRLEASSTMTANSGRMLEGELEAVRHFHQTEFRRSELPHARLKRREMVAWARAVKRDARYHGHFSASPRPPASRPIATLLSACLNGAPGRALLAKWKR